MTAIALTPGTALQQLKALASQGGRDLISR